MQLSNTEHHGIFNISYNIKIIDWQQLSEFRRKQEGLHHTLEAVVKRRLRLKSKK